MLMPYKMIKALSTIFFSYAASVALTINASALLRASISPREPTSSQDQSGSRQQETGTKRHQYPDTGNHSAIVAVDTHDLQSMAFGIRISLIVAEKATSEDQKSGGRSDRRKHR
jgi:hypothetical protein